MCVHATVARGKTTQVGMCALTRLQSQPRNHFALTKSKPHARHSSAPPPIPGQLVGAGDELHTLPVQLEVLRVVTTLEDVGNAAVAETALEDRIVRIQLQEHDVHLASTLVAVWPSVSLNLREAGRRRESPQGKRRQQVVC